MTDDKYYFIRMSVEAIHPELQDFIKAYDRMCLANERFTKAKDELKFFQNTQWHDKEEIAKERYSIMNEKLFEEREEFKKESAKVAEHLPLQVW